MRNTFLMTPLSSCYSYLFMLPFLLSVVFFLKLLLMLCFLHSDMCLPPPDLISLSALRLTVNDLTVHLITVI